MSEPSDTSGLPLDTPRRVFLARLSLALTALGAAVVGVPVVGFILGPLLQKVTPEWRVVGMGPREELRTPTAAKVPGSDTPTKGAVPAGSASQKSSPPRA